MNSTLPAQLPDLLVDNHTFLCVSHVSPDGDAYGSLLGMCWLLHALGKTCVPAMQEPVLEEFAFLPGAETIVGPDDVGASYNLIIALDASSMDRLGHVYRPERHAHIPMVVIDHHITNTRFGTVNWVDAGCAATCEMLVHLADAMGIPLSGALAECLLTGIVTDTLGFRTSNTSPEVLEAAVHLQRGGANLADIVARTLNRMPFNTLRLWSLVLPNAQLEDGVLWTAIRQSDLREAQLPTEDSRLNSVFSSVIEADLSAVFTEKIGENGQPAVECSFRAKPGFTVGDLAFSFGGGGHAPASGCTIDGTLTEVIATVVPALKEARRRQALSQS